MCSRLSRSAPAWMRESSNRSSTIPVSRSTDCLIRVWYVAGSSATRSSSASAIARSPASGVRRSCETQATSSRRERSIARSRSLDSIRRWAVTANSRRNASNSPVESASVERVRADDATADGVCTTSSAISAPRASSRPSWRSAVCSARLSRLTLWASNIAMVSATTPAATQTTSITPKSCWDRNIACAVASTPAAIAHTTVMANVNSFSRTARPRSSRRAKRPTHPTAAAHPPAIRTIWMMSVTRTLRGGNGRIHRIRQIGMNCRAHRGRRAGSPRPTPSPDGAASPGRARSSRAADARGR